VITRKGFRYLGNNIQIKIINDQYRNNNTLKIKHKKLEIKRLGNRKIRKKTGSRDSRFLILNNNSV
jgi:hypothetical protein